MTGAAIICNFDGAGGEGATCGSPDDCGAGMACVDATGALECRTLCDATHACPGGSACTDLTDVPGLGFCPVET